MTKKTTGFLRLVMAATVLIFSIYLLIDAWKTDDESPVISIENGELLVSVNDPESVLLQGVMAKDNKDGDITDSLMIESVYGITEDGRATVTIAAVDSAGNVSQVERTVRYKDYTSPRLSLRGPLVFEFGSYFDVLDHTQAHDVFEGDISRRIKPTMLSNGTSVAEEGTHTVQFRVTNSMGDTSQLVLHVEVYPVGRYNAQVSLTDYLIYLSVGDDFKARDYLMQLRIQEESFNLKDRIPGGAKVSITGEVDSGVPGVYPVAYTVTYQYNGLVYTGYTKLFVVVET